MVTVEQILDFWAQAGTGDAKDYCLDVSHPLGVFSSVNEGRPAFLIISPVDPRDHISFNVDAIKLEIGHRAWDNQWVVYFTLSNPRLDVAFAELAASLANISRGAHDPVEAMRLVGQSIQELQLLFAIASQRKPNLQEVRGLFAELWFLEQLVAPKFGIQVAVESWKGPLGATHDFDLSDSTFYEVKSRRWNSSRIHISSPAQLSLEHGELILAVVAFDDSAAPASLSVWSLFSRIIEMEGCGAATIALLRARLSAAGFDLEDDVYQSARFTKPEIRTYSVNERFPRLDLKDIPLGLSRVSYQLSTEYLTEFEIDWPGE